MMTETETLATKPPLREAYWSDRRLAEFLDVHTNTLRRMRNQKRGPAWIKIARRVLYREADIAAWIESQRNEGEAA